MTIVDEHVQRWHGWITGPIRNDILGMHHKRQIWREICEMLDRNPQVSELDSSFWPWMRELYATTQAIGIRRQADRDRRSCSLARLIEEMRGDADRLTRDYFVGLWDTAATDAWMMRQAQEAFDALGGSGGDHLDPAVPAADLARLGNDAAKMRVFVNEHVAHDAAEPTAGPATFDDMNAAIDSMGSMFKKYANALTAGSYVFLEPVIQNDWKAIFRQPWLVG